MHTENVKTGEGPDALCQITCSKNVEVRGRGRQKRRGGRGQAAGRVEGEIFWLSGYKQSAMGLHDRAGRCILSILPAIDLEFFCFTRGGVVDHKKFLGCKIGLGFVFVATH